MSQARQYVDFRLELRDLDEATDTFKVSVPYSAVGETEQAFSVPYRRAAMEDHLDDLERKRIDQQGVIALGEQLAERLLPAGPVRELLQKALDQAGRDGRVRLRLIIRDNKLAQLPWEFTYLQRHHGEKDRRHFLVLNPQVSLVRHEALPDEHPSTVGATPGKLRLVAAMANAKGYPKLKLNREKEVIEGALRDIKVDGVTIEAEPFIEDATLDSLTMALQKGADLFHYAGHGEFNLEGTDARTGESTGVGNLVLAGGDAAGEARLLPAGELALHLQRAGVRVAVLGACESGRRDGISAWTGIAPALAERGVAAIVANQYEVLDDHALAFSQMFYSALAAGLSVDEAVSAGRLAMLGKSNEDDIEWGVPVLYMRAADGIVFPKLAERPSKTAAEIRRVVQQTVETIEAGGEVVGIVAKRATGAFEVVQKATTVKGKMVGVQLDEL